VSNFRTLKEQIEDAEKMYAETSVEEQRRYFWKLLKMLYKALRIENKNA
jgi:hypothetical protein